MTETLHASIQRLLVRLEEQQAGAAEPAPPASLLDARLCADLAEALAANAARPQGDAPRELNDLAIWLAGAPSAAEREEMIAKLLTSPEDRAALQSAAAFLADLKTAPEPVPQALMADALAIFVPAENAAAAAAPRRWFALPAWAAVAALLAVGILGSDQLSRLGQPLQTPNVHSAASAARTPSAAATMHFKTTATPPAAPAQRMRPENAAGAANASGACGSRLDVKAGQHQPGRAHKAAESANQNAAHAETARQPCASKLRSLALPQAKPPKPSSPASR